jgi:hypothetical protein
VKTTKRKKRKEGKPIIYPPGRTEKNGKKQILSLPIIKWFWGCIVVAATLIGLLSAYYQFQPLVSVIPSYSLNPTNALSAQFQVCNQSVFSIYDVSNYYNVNHIKVGHVDFVENTMHKNRGQHITELRSKEATVLEVGWGIGGMAPSFCDVTISVTYRPKFIWWRKEQQFRFTTKTNSASDLLWFPESLSEQYPKSEDFMNQPH